jgi:hypothetical protein
MAGKDDILRLILGDQLNAAHSSGWNCPTPAP